MDGDSSCEEAKVALTAIWCAIAAMEEVQKGDEEKARAWTLNCQAAAGSIPPWKLAAVAAFAMNRELVLVVADKLDKSGEMRECLIGDLFALADIVDGYDIPHGV